MIIRKLLKKKSKEFRSSTKYRSWCTYYSDPTTTKECKFNASGEIIKIETKS